MNLSDVNSRGLVLLGCGKMGSALLQGWLANGVRPESVWVIDPAPSDWLKAQSVHINENLPAAPAVVLVAVKPQMMGDALPQLSGITANTLVLSIAAGTPISAFEAAFGVTVPIVRSMPNTPAAIGMGITAIVGNAATEESHLSMAEALLSAVGEVVRLDDEDQIDAVTGVSGSGPAYVFHLIETLAAGGVTQGLSPDLAMQLAKATVAGAGKLAMVSEDEPAQLRVNVTSPGGTTAAALKVLMNEENGFPKLVPEAVTAATNRGRELRG